MSVLDLIAGNEQHAIDLLDKPNMPDDLQALRRALRAWNTNNLIDVGESATLYRFLSALGWDQKLQKRFVISGSLRERKISHPSVLEQTTKELLQLDGGTSQWASAKFLLGAAEKIPNPPYKLSLTYEAVEQWTPDCDWQLRPDPTIQRQIKAFERLRSGKPHNFTPQHSEDYCFAVALCGLDPKESARWPSLANHESNRPDMIIHALEEYKYNISISSSDHRVVQAIAMLAIVDDKYVSFEHPDCVTKSWSLFWQYLST